MHSFCVNIYARSLFFFLLSISHKSCESSLFLTHYPFAQAKPITPYCSTWTAKIPVWAWAVRHSLSLSQPCWTMWKSAWEPQVTNLNTNILCLTKHFPSSKRRFHTQSRLPRRETPRADAHQPAASLPLGVRLQIGRRRERGALLSQRGRRDAQAVAPAIGVGRQKSERSRSAIGQATGERQSGRRQRRSVGRQEGGGHRGADWSGGFPQEFDAIAKGGWDKCRISYVHLMRNSRLLRCPITKMHSKII